MILEHTLEVKLKVETKEDPEKMKHVPHEEFAEYMEAQFCELIETISEEIEEDYTNETDYVKVSVQVIQ